ncbi:MAG: hormogonium polysaccharide secretion pseudopilin HpsB [Nostoc sp. ChiSLP02]|nr:hormogonium polysaccharide secretion pseudopilin HpsB [Nostoc sp. DedSLP05]MDZ8100351.1 hormogonium polysaccharide secretion pseudopilin HpsB [Nostoc sp. DedSLP01]MDZ8188357.1 hormogonium polysaccharide secretion pseudopilin HpsB [Nostoc sp. ChiSLP02]
MMIGKQANKQSLKVAVFCLRNSTGGFTIIESLVAILVVSVLLVAIAPVLSLSVATRVQSRRVELATQAARSYIDAVKTKKVAAPTSTGSNTLTAYAAPTATGTLTCPTANSYCTSSTELYCVDFDSSGSCENTSLTDMIVQGFRYNSASSNASSGYALGVRVYRADAFKQSTTLLKNTSTTKTTQATYTGGAGQRKAPLVEMTTDINDTVPKYTDLCARYTGGCN